MLLGPNYTVYNMGRQSNPLLRPKKYLVQPSEMHVTTLEELENQIFMTERVCECLYFAIIGLTSKTVAIAHFYKNDKDRFETHEGQSYSSDMKRHLLAGEKVFIVALGGNPNSLVLPRKGDFQQNDEFRTRKWNAASKEYDYTRLDYPEYRALRKSSGVNYMGIGVRLGKQFFEFLENAILDGHLISARSREDVQEIVAQARLVVHPEDPDPEYCFHDVNKPWPLQLENFVGDRNIRLLKKQFPEAEFIHFYTRLGCNIELTCKAGSLEFKVTNPSTQESQTIEVPLPECA